MILNTDTTHKKIVSILVLVVFVIYISPIFSACFLYAQEKAPEKDADNKPKIIFKSSAEPDSLKRQSTKPDTAKPKIIFENKQLLISGQIKLLTTKQFRVDDQTHFVGENAINLKGFMGRNPEAIALIDQAYDKHNTGTTLMVIGGIVAAAGFALPLKIAETETSYYLWFPGVTLGVVIGGIGFSKYNSLKRDLFDAVKMYNENLARQNPDNIP